MVHWHQLRDQSVLPAVVEVEAPGGEAHGCGSLESWYLTNEPHVRSRLLEYGAILYRGFNVNTPAAFARFTRSASRTLLDGKEENVPRTRLSSGVYTSSEYPAEYVLSMHSEYAYSNVWPSRLFFCCIIASQSGGETPLADNREILRRLRPEIVSEFRSKKITYLRHLHDGQGFGLSWQAAFQTPDKGQVENYCRSSGVNYTWTTNGLRLQQTLDAVISHPVTRELVWFNQAPQFHPSDYPPEICGSIQDTYKEELPQDVRFGDGTPIDVEMLASIRDTMLEAAVVYPWQVGDVVEIDNVLVSHGRMPFVGPRKILVSMTKD